MPTLDRGRLEKLVAELMEKEFARIPKMREFHEGTWTDREYYVRDLVETVLRIRLNNEVDTYALFKVGSKDDMLAANLAKYLAEEFGHEHMFLRDLEVFGVSLTDVDVTPVMPATAMLMGYLRLAVDREGPAPTTVWDWFVEWYSDRYFQAITDKAAQAFGALHVRGTQTHIDFDNSHDHDELMFRVVRRAVGGWSTPEDAEAHLTTYVQLVGEYFREVYEATVGKRALAAAEPVGAST